MKLVLFAMPFIGFLLYTEELPTREESNLIHDDSMKNVPFRGRLLPSVGNQTQ